MPIANFGDRPRVESGTILMWAGTLADMPSGWVLCDGNNGTPDLRDRFIKSTTSVSDSTGATGGQSSYTVTTAKMAPHDHNGETDEAGDHSHALNHVYYSNSRHGSNANNAKGNGSTGSSTDGAHTHSMSVDTVGSGQSVDNMPAYYELAFIMKT